MSNVFCLLLTHSSITPKLGGPGPDEAMSQHQLGRDTSDSDLNYVDAPMFVHQTFIHCLFFFLKDDNQTGISSLGFVSQLPGVFILYLIRYKLAKMQTLG